MTHAEIKNRLDSIETNIQNVKLDIAPDWTPEGIAMVIDSIVLRLQTLSAQVLEKNGIAPLQNSNH